MKDTLNVGETKGLLKEGKHFAVDNLVMVYKKTEEKPIKLSISIQTKHVKRAVDRNYLKRLLREVCKEKMNVSGRAMLIYKNKDFKNESKENLEKSVASLLGKINSV